MNIAGKEPAIYEGVLGKKSLRSSTFIDSLKTFEERRCTIYKTRFQYQKGLSVKTVQLANIASVEQDEHYCILNTTGVKTIVLEAGSVDEAGEWLAAFVSAGVRPADDGSGSDGDCLSARLRGDSNARVVPVAAAALAWMCDDSATSARVASILLKHATVSGQAKATGQAMGLLLATSFLNPNSRLGARPLPEQWLNALVRSELGLLEFHPTPASSSSSSSSSSSPSGAPETTATAKLSRTPHALLLRRETTATVALSTYLKLALQWGNITHAVCGPLLQRAQQIVSSSSPGSANSSSNSSGKCANANANVDEKLWPAVGDAVLRLEDALTTLKNRQANESNCIEGESDDEDDEEDEDGEGEPIDNFYGNDRSFGAAPHERAAVRMIQAYLHAARDGAIARVDADVNDQVSPTDCASEHEYFSALASGVVLRGFAPALLSPQPSGCAAPSPLLASHRTHRSSGSRGGAGSAFARTTDLNSLEGLQALLADPHAPLVLVYAGSSSAKLDSSQRRLIEHCLPLPTFLKAQHAHPAALASYSVVFLSRDGSTAITVRDNQRKHHKRQRCGAQSLMNDDVMQALSQYSRNWTQAKASHTANVALLSAPTSPSTTTLRASESALSPHRTLTSFPSMGPTNDAPPNPAEARRALWYAAVDSTSAAAVAVLAHLLVRARGNRRGSSSSTGGVGQDSSVKPSDNNLAAGWSAVLKLSGSDRSQGRCSSSSSLSLAEAAAQVDTFLTREAPSHYNGWGGGADPTQFKGYSSTRGRAGSGAGEARRSFKGREQEHLNSSSSVLSSPIQTNDGGKRAAVLLQKVANKVPAAPEAPPLWVMPVVPLGNDSSGEDGSQSTGGKRGSQDQVLVALAGQLRRCWRRAADMQEPLLEAELCLDDDDDESDGSTGDGSSERGRRSGGADTGPINAGTLLDAMHDSVFGDASSNNRHRKPPIRTTAEVVGGSDNSSALTPTSPLAFELPGLDLDLDLDFGFELPSPFSPFVGIAASPSSLGTRHSHQNSPSGGSTVHTL